ncbi:MAG: hypothetical protein H0W02_23545 [Ktedonobacteraceae bacterium]|nr:hypothetical protein [Ktedonobacteraceae bacterium]
MQADPEHHKQPESEPGRPVRPGPLDTSEFVDPGIHIIRSSTPRPLSFGQMVERSQHQERSESEAEAPFPVEAPGAPPVPEEYGRVDGALNIPDETPLPSPHPQEAVATQEPGEFLWLFEYGPEMDGAILNSPQKLDGLALPYGPALLNDYQLAFSISRGNPGHIVASIVPSSEPGAAVWGVLYRIPRRLADSRAGEPSLLDMVHATPLLDGVFERVHVVVREMHRQRDIACVTYRASVAALKHFYVRLLERPADENAYMRRLLASARKQNLPDAYLQELARRASPPQEQAPSAVPPIMVSTLEQNTEPLPVLREQVSRLKDKDTVKQKTHPGWRQERWLMALALYMVFLLLAVLTLAVIQGLGFGHDVFTASFTPLGIPWFVLIYGLLGGCVSCMVTLGRRTWPPVPPFILVTWFMRPFIGVVLAMLAYLALDSGFIVIGGVLAHRDALYSLTGVLAGLCEGWVFYRKRS